MPNSSFNRSIYARSARFPQGAPPDPGLSVLENIFHSPGEVAAIRFYDPYSTEDLEAIRSILRGKEVKKWMDDTNIITQSEYRDWAGTATYDSFLFAPLDTRLSVAEQILIARGFVYIYSEREEKFRVRRMEKFGLIEPISSENHYLEISFAGRPQLDGTQTGSGLISSAVRLSCWQVQMMLQQDVQKNAVIFAFVDQANFPAHRTLKASGFVYKGLMKYDADSADASALYVLNWRLLRQKIRQKYLHSKA